VSLQPTSSPPQPLELRLSNDPAEIAPARRAIEAFCTAHGLGAHATCEVGLCLNEALANVIRHAYGGASGQPILVTGEWLERAPASADERSYPAGAVRVTIRDWGSGINPAALQTKPHDPLEPGGLGLICLRSMMDEVVYTPQPDGMLLSMTRGERAGS
jgi:anti-sigma regulatory factor (Ser/Thr protein kinase)